MLIVIPIKRGFAELILSLDIKLVWHELVVKNAKLLCPISRHENQICCD